MTHAEIQQVIDNGQYLYWPEEDVLFKPQAYTSRYWIGISYADYCPDGEKDYWYLHGSDWRIATQEEIDRFVK